MQKTKFIPYKKSSHNVASRETLFISIIILILHQYATHIDNKHSWLYCWKGKIYWFDLQYRREAIDVDGGNAKSERELQLFTLKLS